MRFDGKLSAKLRSISPWVFVFQLGILVGIEAVYLAVFTENEDFKVAYGFPKLTAIGLATSLYPIFAAIGAASVLYLVHISGSVAILGASAILWLSGYLLGALIVGKLGVLMIARVIKGFAIGLMTSVMPLYIEKAANSKRQAAQQLTLLQASAPLGILLMALVAKLATPLKFNMRWVGAAVPALPIILVIFYLPCGNGIINQAKEERQSSKLPGVSSWAKMLTDIREVRQSRYNMTRFVAASLTQAAGPLTAVNVIFYYSALMCQMLGFSANEAEYMAIGLYSANFVGTAISLSFINRLHRLATVQYTILSLGSVHILLFATRLSQDYYPEVNFLGMIAIALLFGFVFLFSTFFSGISLVYTSEVVPTRTRGVSIGLATCFGWLCNFVITMLSSAILPVLGSYVFLLFGSICCIMYCVFSVMPQTVRSVLNSPLS